MARGRIKEEDIDKLREQCDLVDVISDYVQLKKAGRVFKGLCPFHDEKTPSFMVDPAKQLYHCFGCGEGGNIFTFLKKKEGLEFRDAVERLASRIGFTLHYEGVSREASEAESRRSRLYRINQWAAEVYHATLKDREAGKQARGYLASRSMDQDAVQAFRLGFAPNRWDFLYRQAMHRGFTAVDFVSVGLGLKGEKGTYDRFRGRLIFPIHDLQDRVIAFGGRVIGEGQPKYLNSPETPIYVKSRHLYALNLARREIVRQGFAILVEGYTDVIGLWQAGIRNVAATLGTALGEEHLKLLEKFTERIVLAFDADTAGIVASVRGLDFFDKVLPDIRVIGLADGMDPADFVANSGPDEFLRLTEQSIPLVDYCLDKVKEEYDPLDTNSRIRGVREAIAMLKGLQRDIERERYIKEIADWSGLSYHTVFDIYRKAPGKGGNETETSDIESHIALPPHVRAERELLRLLIHHNALLPKANEGLDGELFDDQSNSVIFHSLMEKQHQAEQEGAAYDTLAPQLIEDIESEQARNTITALVFDKSGNVDNINDREAEAIYRDLLASLKEFYLERQIRRLKKDLQGLSSADQRNHARERDLSEEIYALERMKRELR
jgi:DNA primase